MICTNADYAFASPPKQRDEQQRIEDRDAGLALLASAGDDELDKLWCAYIGEMAKHWLDWMIAAANRCQDRRRSLPFAAWALDRVKQNGGVIG